MRRPSTSRPPPRGSLKDFLDESYNTEVYGEKKAKEIKQEKARREKQAKLKASLSFGQLKVEDRMLRDECSRSFRQRWFLRDSGEVLFTHHLEKVEVFDVPEEMAKRPQTANNASAAVPSEDLHHSAAFITHFYNTALKHTKDHEEQGPPSQEPQNVLEHYDSIAGSVAAASSVFDPKKPLRIVLSDKMKTQYKMRVQERQLVSIEMLNNDKRDLWLNPDRLSKVTANDVLFLECLRMHVLPYPLRSLHSVVEQVINRNSPPDTPADSLELEDNRPSHQSSSGSKSVKIGRNIAEVLPNTILTLNLTDRSIGHERALCLAEALVYCPTLTTLLIPNNRLDDKAGSSLLDSLIKNTQIVHIDMSENTLGLMCVTLLSNCLENPKRNLQRLILSNCGLTDEHCYQLGQSTIYNRTLIELDLSSNNIGSDEDKFSHVFATLLQANKVLQRLNLANNFLRRKAVREILTSLTYNQTLLQLSLSKNQVMDEDIIHAASDIEKNVTLTNIDLSHNFIASKGCIILTYAFSQKKSAMRWLNLNDNPIGTVAFAFAMKMMRKVATYRDVSDASGPSSPSPVSNSNTAANYNLAKKPSSYNLEEDDEEDLPPQISSSHPKKQQQEQQHKRLLHIACEARKVSEDQLLQLSNLSGIFEFDLSNAYDRTVARYYLDELEANPFGEVKEIKWLNPVIHSYEYPLLHRQNTPFKVSTAQNSNNNSKDCAKEEGFYACILHALEETLHVHIPHSIQHILNDNNDKINRWRKEHNYAAILVYLVEIILPYVIGNASDVTTHVLMHSQMQLPFHDHKSVANIHLTAMEEINRWLSELNIFSDQNSVERNKFILLLINQLLITTLDIVSSPLSVHPTNAKYLVPQAGILHLNIKIPLCMGIKSFLFPSHALHVFLDSFASVPKQYYQLASYLYRLLETKENILNLRCEDAELILKIILRVNLAHHLEIVEKLLLQIDSVMHVRKFIVRNLYFHEIILLRKRMNILFKIITGNVTGHYCFDLSDNNQRNVLMKLVAYHSFERQMYPNLHDVTQDGHHPNFRNASLNGTYIALSADWLQQAPTMGKLRFDYVSYNLTANIMPPSMQILTGNYSTLDVSEEVKRLRKQAFVDVMITNIFSRDMLKKAAHIMRKRNLQPKNSNGEVAVFPFLKSGDANVDDEQENEDDYSFENSSDEEGNTFSSSVPMMNTPGSPKASAKQVVKGERGSGSLLLRRMNVISKGSFLNLKDQSEDIDRGNRSAFLRKNNSNPIITTAAEPGREEAHTTAVAERILNKAKEFHEKKFYVENSILWQDYWKTSWRKYLSMNRNHLIHKANEIYHNILRDTQVSSIPTHSKVERESFPEEVYLAHEYRDAAKLPIYHAVDLVGQNKNSATVSRSPDKMFAAKIKDAHRHAHGNYHDNTAATDKQKAQEKEAIAVMHACIPFETPLLILESFLLYHVYLDSYQVELILSAFKERDAPFFVLVRVITILWIVVTDKENLGHVVLSVLGDKVYDECVHRLGFPALWSPLHPVGKYAFDLAAADHRVVLSSLLHLLIEDKSLEVEDCEHQSSGLQARHPFDLRKNNSIQDIPMYGQLIFRVTQHLQMDEDELAKRRQMVSQRTFFRQTPPMSIPNL